MSSLSPSTTPAAATKHVVLVMHGFGQSASSIMAKTGALRSEVKRLGFEFVPLDGPLECLTQAKMPAAAAAAASSASAPSSDDANAGQPQQQQQQLTLEPGARAWYSFEHVDATGRYDLFEEGVQYVLSFLAEREKSPGGSCPIRGIFAFSQGTIVAAVLAKRKAALGPSSPLRALEFCCFFSGLLPKDVALKQELLLPCVSMRRQHGKDKGDENDDDGDDDEVSSCIPLHSYHCIGSQDQLVKPELSLELRRCFPSPDASSKWLNDLHQGDFAHVIPSSARKSFADFAKKVVALL